MLEGVGRWSGRPPRLLRLRVRAFDARDVAGTQAQDGPHVRPAPGVELDPGALVPLVGEAVGLDFLGGSRRRAGS